MAKGRSPWQDGRRAWQRLNGWHQDGPSASPGHPDDGDSALEALVDVGRIRHLLDQAELVAVRTARKHRKSWAEIATKLGVSRQSAWERWRELDDEASPSRREVALDVAATEPAEAPGEVSEPARERRRQSSVVVPNVVGKTWDDARQMLLDRRLVAVGSEPDGPPMMAAGWPGGTVTDQSPEAGARVPAGAPVRLWLERGGGGSAGVREPRRPKPEPRAAREMRDEPSDRAVG